MSWTTREDHGRGPCPCGACSCPWATLEKPKDDLVQREIPELKGGDWARGRALFFGEQAKCSACHKVRGRGGEIGPDLSNLVHRDYASVYRDIHTPSAAINPDYIAHTVALTDGRVLQGTLRTEGDRLIVGDTDGQADERRSRGGRGDVAVGRPRSCPRGSTRPWGPSGCATC